MVNSSPKNLHPKDYVLRFNTKKYQAVPLEDTEGKSMFMVTTARKSTVQVQNVCPQCKTPISRAEIKFCALCGHDICPNCLRKDGQTLFCRSCYEEIL